MLVPRVPTAGNATAQQKMPSPCDDGRAETARFDALLQVLTKEMPDAASAEQLKTGLRKLWDQPPLEALELMAQRTYNLDQARLLLFFPEPVDMATYVALIMPAEKGAPKTHPVNRVRKHFLTMLYMQHVHSWPHMRECESAAYEPPIRLVCAAHPHDLALVLLLSCQSFAKGVSSDSRKGSPTTTSISARR